MLENNREKDPFWYFTLMWRIAMQKVYIKILVMYMRLQ